LLSKTSPSDIQLFLDNELDDARAMVRAAAGSGILEVAAPVAFGVSGAAVAAAIEGFDRDGWPKLVVVDEAQLHGARAAYDLASDTIYATRAADIGVLIEELGHAIDARVNKSDAPGDEGAIFASFVTGKEIDVAALKAENDHGTIVIDGKTVAVEFAAPVVGSITLDGSLADWTAA
jgi:hypothetical protein